MKARGRGECAWGSHTSRTRRAYKTLKSFRPLRRVKKNNNNALGKEKTTHSRALYRLISFTFILFSRVYIASPSRCCEITCSFFSSCRFRSLTISDLYSDRLWSRADKLRRHSQPLGPAPKARAVERP